MKQRPSVIGPFLTGLIMLWGGARTAISGQAGHKAAYATGDHVRLGGALVFGLGVWLLVVAIRRKTKKAVPVITANTPRGRS